MPFDEFSRRFPDRRGPETEQERADADTDFIFTAIRYQSISMTRDILQNFQDLAQAGESEIVHLPPQPNVLVGMSLLRSFHFMKR